MFKKIAIILGLAMVAGTSLAAEDGMSHDKMGNDQMSHDAMSQDSMRHDKMGNDQMGHDAMGQDSMGHDKMDMQSKDGGMSMDAQFDALDTNGDGAISRSEASANPQMASMYDSFDTSATIEKRAGDTNPAGITRDQFDAGMQAAAAGGVVGPAVSGGGMQAGGDSMSHDKMSGGDSMSHDKMGEGDSMSHEDKMSGGDEMSHDDTMQKEQ